MEQKIKVSVIMPFLNSITYLKECMDSVINQTLKEIEIICVDAGSTDGTLELLQEYAEKDKRIRIINSTKKSYGMQMNLGLKYAKGKYIGIVESDDFVELNMYEELYEIAIKNNLDIIKSDYYHFKGTVDREKKYFNIIPWKDLYNKILNPEKEKRCVSFTLTVTGLYKKEFIDFYNINYNETPGASYQDNGFCFQTSCYANRIMFYNKAFYWYRQDNPNSSINNPNKVFAICDEYKFIYNKLKNDYKIYEKFINKFYRSLFYSYFSAYYRIAEEYKLMFLKKFSEDLISLKEVEVYFPKEFDRENQKKLVDIINDYKKFYFQDRSFLYISRGSSDEIFDNNIVKEIVRLKDDINNLKGSLSFKIGRFVTYIPRKIRDLFL